MSVQDLLEEVLKGNYSYEFVGKTIIIRPVKQSDKKIVIQGTVKDQQGGSLPGVTVLVKGSTIGVSTDGNGKFRLEVASADSLVLVFSFVGMETKEVAYWGETELNVVMKEKDAKLDEVVVTGYQQIEKRQLTSAVSSVKTEDLNMIGATSIEQMLQGQLAGLSVINISAAPGAAPKIRVRGTATITGNADPLWVLDGVMLENSVPISVAELNSPDVMNMFNSAIGGINPSDIESITVLKDASATAIYGTRAANGVIVVTTKKGKRDGGFNISYQHTSSVSLRPSYDDFDLLNSQERVELTQQCYDDGLRVSGVVGMENLMQQYGLGNLSLEEYKQKVRELETRNTDWFKILFRNAYTQTHNLSISGGTEKMDYYVSMSYNGEQGADKISEYKNYGGLAKMNAELFKGVRLGTTLQVGRRDRESYHTSIDPFMYAVRTSRTIPLYDENGDYFFYKKSVGGYYLFNILFEQENTKRESTQTDLKGIVNLTVNLYKGLKYNGLFSYSSSHSASIDYAKEQSAYVANLRGYDFGNPTEEELAETPLPFGGVYNETDYEQRTSLIRNGLEYKGHIGDDLSIDGMLGQEFRTTKYRGLTTQNYGYMHDRGNIFYEPSLGESTGHLFRNMVIRNVPERSYISYYGVLSAMYKDRYVINGNIRFDGSNLFGSNPKYRYLPLWSVSAKWIVSNENFLAGVSMLNDLAIRASYGLRGNIVEDSSPQIIASALPPNKFNDLLEMKIDQAPNPDLKWETTSSLNVGLELSMLNNRLSVDVDYYRDASRDLIASKDVSAVTGFLNKYVNYANVKNQGVDIAVSGYIIRSKQVSWMSSLNLGYVKNKVTKSNITPQAQNLVKSVYTPGEVYLGKPVNGMFSYRFAELDADGMPLFYDQDNNKLNAGDTELPTAVFSNIENLKYEGTRDPILTGGFNNVIKYKEFTLSFLFSFGLKNVIRLPEYAYNSSPSDDQNANRRIMERWRKPGDEATKVIPCLSGGSGYFTTADGTYYTTGLFNQSQVTVVPGDYLRLRNVMLEYRLPRQLVQKIVIGGCSLGGISLKLQAQNLFVLADRRLKGYDPETINYTTTAYGSQPLPTSFTLGLNVNF
ncbi:SusC/RagA family TonB-linked outer membrane protein [Butyricimonas faecalis]|uniref:SusC/RagA family TonB-linked outer membrane protein n=2 Tax=Butyricimonas faecalis TaxID=2093856 RepID=A0A3S9VQ24_9BACT|nr:SusC/RagA family TonB-linked outer membrane protein [Butyricimonas faecalis]